MYHIGYHEEGGIYMSHYVGEFSNLKSAKAEMGKIGYPYIANLAKDGKTWEDVIAIHDYVLERLPHKKTKNNKSRLYLTYGLPFSPRHN